MFSVSQTVFFQKYKNANAIFYDIRLSRNVRYMLSMYILETKTNIKFLYVATKKRVQVSRYEHWHSHISVHTATCNVVSWRT